MIKRYIYIYFRLINQHLKAILEYQADFLITMFAAMLTQILGFIFLWVLYDSIPDINGWLFWEVAFIYALVFFTEGFASLFFDGIWHISSLVNRGEFDRILVRPISPILQVLGSAVGINGVGNLFIGGVIIYQALNHIEIDWSISKLLFSLLLLLSAILIRVSIYFAACSSVFWTQSPGNAFGNMVHTLSEFAKFPITIYSFGVQALITVILPYAFVSFFPSAYLFNKQELSSFGFLVPVVAVYCVSMSFFIFKKGIQNYESVGN
ncbi:ABC transporter permease [Metabacillus halosaccharovorans]|uniref:ABC-2 family transporter protein n=1 Tax=Metabacillus halosaccharovorans TaxID=930124 RepID=UPI00403D9F73